MIHALIIIKSGLFFKNQTPTLEMLVSFDRCMDAVEKNVVFATIFD